MYGHIKRFLSCIYYKCFIKFSKKFSRENLYKFLEKSIEEYVLTKDKKNLKIINFGAGGEIGKILKSKIISHKHKLFEIDIDKKRKPDLILDLQNMHAIKDNSIDIIFCLEVLEHVSNPFKAIKEIKRVLKDGGIFIGSTPFIMPIHDEPHDYFRYTKYGILNLFKGFECLELKERNSYIKSSYVVILRLLNIGNKKEKILMILLFPFILSYIPFILIFDKLITNTKSTTGYFYIFKK